MASAGSSIGGRTHVRHWILLLLFVITTISFADRATLSMAGPGLTKDLGLDPVALGYVLSSFAIAYVVAQIPGGMLLDRFGSKPVYIAALLLWSLFTLLQGFVGLLSTVGAAVTALFGLRFLMGIAEAPCFPANARIVANWFPTAERGTASAIFNAAQYFSLVAFAPLMGWLASGFGWASIFYVMGGLGLVAAVVLGAFVRSPRSHPLANAAEIAFIAEGGALIDMEEGARGPSAFTWHNVRQVLTSRMLIGIYLGQYCINVLTYFFATWFPIYLVQQRHMSILHAGFLSAVPAIFGFAGGVLGGVVSDALLRRTGSLTFSRKAPLLVGMLIALSIILANYAQSQTLVIVVMTLAFFGKGVASLGWAVIADTSPRELLGVTGGIFNMAGNTAGIVMPIVVGYLVKATGSFDSALIFVGAHCLLTIFAYFVITKDIVRLELAPAR